MASSRVQIVTIIAAISRHILTTSATPNNADNSSMSLVFLPLELSPPTDSAIPLEAFVSYSIEQSSFVDYAGNISHPNTYSNNLLLNIGELTGTKPYIRVGGNSADISKFDKNLKQAWSWVIDPKDPRHPKNETFGPSFFESYQTWPNTRFIHGFNLASNSTAARNAMLESVSYACQALGGGKLKDLQLGNEPDLYTKLGTDGKRRRTFDDSSYTFEWLLWAGKIRSEIEESCPDMVTDGQFKFYAPAIAGYNALHPAKIFEKGYNKDGWVEYIDHHNYQNSAENPKVTLQGTLMSHPVTSTSVRRLLDVALSLKNLSAEAKVNLLFVLGEANSLAGGGRQGLSNTFGAALWGIDFNLLSASSGIGRVHMHQGNGAPYQSWQPVDTATATKGTKAPYYGNVAVASFLGNISSGDKAAKIANIPLPRDQEAAYAAYDDNKLSRLLIHYGFELPKGAYCRYTLQRLLANGSDAISGVTFDGYSYDYTLDNGKPVLLNNVTRGEQGEIASDGRIYIDVPRSSAVIVRLE